MTTFLLRLAYTPTNLYINTSLETPPNHSLFSFNNYGAVCGNAIISSKLLVGTKPRWLCRSKLFPARPTPRETKKSLLKKEKWHLLLSSRQSSLPSMPGEAPKSPPLKSSATTHFARC